jgi:outer membrane immunogenic protein
MKKNLIGITVIAALIATPALAADLNLPAYNAPPPPPFVPIFNWTGFYIGGNAGWGWLNDNGSPFCINPEGVLDGDLCDTTNVPGAQIKNANGFIGGGQAGFDYQADVLVYGIETDFQGADINGSVNIAGPFAQVGGGNSGPASFTASEKLDWLGTVRGRIGVVAWERSLFYGTVGFAYGGVSASQNTIFPAVQYPSSVSETRTGWTAGGGWEYAFAPNWSAKIEGLYYDLGSFSTSGTAVPGITSFIGGKNFDAKGAIVRVGLNWRFNGFGH